MTQPDDSTVDKAVFAAWYDFNWERLDSLLDAHQSGDHKRLASLLDPRQRALQSRASAVGDQPKRQRLLGGLQLSIERGIIEQVAAALGLDNPPAKTRHQRQRKPSIKKTIAAAERSGKTVTSITTPDGVTLRFGESEPTEANNPWLAGIDDKVTKQ